MYVGNKLFRAIYDKLTPGCTAFLGMQSISIVKNGPNQITPEILREFIDKIVVYHRELVGAQMSPKVEFWHIVGNIDVLDILNKRIILIILGKKELYSF